MKHISAMLKRNPGISRYRGFLSCPPIILLVKTGNGIKILNIFTFSHTDCGAYNFAALVFFCPSNKNNSLTLIFICLSPQLRDHCGIFYVLSLSPDNHDRSAPAFITG
ncbi:hypothetical protein ACISPA_005286, partial [Escherichia coli]